MSHIAFYAPLKSPDHPNPSGDREMARNLMDVAAQALGYPLRLMSSLRSFDATGSKTEQTRILQAAQAEIDRVLATDPAPILWITYHNYYKAPDLLGPVISAALNIPYVLVEATRARSRLDGPWAEFARAADRASDAAAVIFHFTQNDSIALNRDKTPAQQVIELPPFLNRDELPPCSSLEGPMLSVGMMRHKDKLRSYHLIADALGRVKTQTWSLDIVGDGEARCDVDALFAPFGDRVRFHGALDRGALDRLYSRASLFVWPGVNEAFGMVYLEAQAAGLPVIAQDRPGVRDVLAPGPYPDPAEGPEALAHDIDALLGSPDRRRTAGDQARRYMRARHLRPAAVGVLRDTLRPLIDGYRT